MILNNDICRVYTDFPKTGHILRSLTVAMYTAGILDDSKRLELEGAKFVAVAYENG